MSIEKEINKAKMANFMESLNGLRIYNQQLSSFLAVLLKAAPDNGVIVPLDDLTEQVKKSETIQFSFLEKEGKKYIAASVIPLPGKPNANSTLPIILRPDDSFEQSEPPRQG